MVKPAARAMTGPPSARIADRLRYWSGRGLDLSHAKRSYAVVCQRFYLQVPGWLARRADGVSRQGLTARALRDIESAQYALFLVAHLHDDVADHAAADRRAVYAADDLLMEAEQQFARRLGEDRWFWRHFRACVTDAVRAAAQLSERQRRPGAMDRAALPLYGRMSRMLVIGAAAVCAISNRRRDFTRVVPLVHELAIAAQIMDDLFDLDEDLADGRFNFAANCLGIDDRHGAAAADGRLGRAVLLEDAIGRILGEVERHLTRAAQIARSMTLQEAIVHVERLRAQSRALSTAVQRARLEHLFTESASAEGGRVRRSSRSSRRRRAVA